MTFRSYDNVQDMFEEIRRGTEAAKQRATPEQNAITKGDYWIRSYAEYQLLIFGYIMTDEELYSGTAYSGVSQAEIEEEKRMAANSYADGYRFGWAYSVAEPEGELGSTHVSTMYKITKEQFEEAKAANWSPERIIHMPWFYELVAKYG